MKLLQLHWRHWLGVLVALTAPALCAQSPQFTRPQFDSGAELTLRLDSTSGQRYRLQYSTNLVDWHSLVTLQSTGLQQHTDSATPFAGMRYYRAFQTATNEVTGDYIPTASEDAVMHLFSHATFMLQWDGKNIYVDPTVTTFTSQGFPRADLILVTHEHQDHYNRSALNSLTNAGTAIVAPLYIYQNLASNNSPLTNRVTVLTNYAITTLLGITIEATPATNSNHPAGRGNGYILTMGGTRLYISGDTGHLIDRRQMANIDVAFVCMDGQFNMNVTYAATFVRAIRPKVVYPYHYNQANPLIFKNLVGTDLGIEVRMRKWE